MLTPSQVSESLTVPTSTLRRWSKRFSKHLTPHKPNTHRRFTPSDLETLRKIRDLLDNGLTYDEIEPKLDIIEPDNSTALLNLADYNHILETYNATIASMQIEIKELKTFKTEFNKWASLPLHKRIFTKPPKEN